MEYYTIENNPEYLNLQIEMIAMQKWVQDSDQRVVILFEGRDTAGKGGAIMRFVRYLNPRGYRIVALPKPSDLERGQWYFQRYIKELPNPGEIVFFDRSWYNRAVVEPVMNFCTEEQYEIFMKNVVTIEKMLVEDKIHLFKLWFSIDEVERISDPLKNWKLSTVDIQAQLKWKDYTKFKFQMFNNTSWEKAPWVILKGNDKEKARMEAMRYVLFSLDYADKKSTNEPCPPNSSIVTIYTGADHAI
jgi:polyphosphate kinase